MTQQSSNLFTRYQYLRQIPIFSKLDWTDLQKVARRAVVTMSPKGELICQQGDPPDYLYCVVSGRVQAYATDPQGRKKDVEFMRRGMHFGIISLLTGENHSLSFVAINDSLILKINKDDFHMLLGSVPQLGIAFSQSLSQRLHRHATAVKSIFESTIISVYSPAAGSGGSTYAANLALNLAQQTKKKTILVHIVSVQRAETGRLASIQEAVLHWKGRPVRLTEFAHDDNRFAEVVNHGGLPFDRIHVSCDPQEALSLHQITHFVTRLVVDYHYVVVDLPSHMDRVVLKTLTQSDLVILISLERQDDLNMTGQVIDQMEGSLKENFSLDRVQVLLNSREDIPSLPLKVVNSELDLEVEVRLPVIQTQDFGEVLETSDLLFRIPKGESMYAQVVRKMAREIGRVLVGLVLGGGAALGIAHIGVLKVFEDEGIPIDVIAGSSMGALIASLWVTGKNCREIEVLAHKFDSGKGIMGLLDPVFPVSGFIGGKAIRRWLKRYLGSKTFHEARIPLKIVAYDLVRRQDIVFDSGLIADAVQRSTAIPGVIEPVIEEDKVIIDGGILNPLPINVLSSRGVNRIIAVNVLPSPEDVTNGYLAEQQAIREKYKISFLKFPLEYVRFRLSRILRGHSPNISDIIIATLQATSYVLAEQSSHHADVLIHPDMSGISWFELYRVDELIRRGEQAAREALPNVRRLVAE